MARSATTVPKDFSTGIPSYLLRIAHLETSPNLGTARFAKYIIITAKKVLDNLGL